MLRTTRVREMHAMEFSGRSARSMGGAMATQSAAEGDPGRDRDVV